jgi:hypothetical protein
MTENKNAIDYVLDFVSELLPYANTTIGHDYQLTIGTKDAHVSIYIGRDLIDDFSEALKRDCRNNYFYTIENRFKFKIYEELGQEGLIPDFDICTAILEEKGQWLKTIKSCVSFDKNFCKVLRNGLNQLSDALGSILSTSDIELAEIEADKKVVDNLIHYHKDNGHFTTSGAEIESLAFLKAASVCTIMELDQKKRASKISRVKKGYGKEIYAIISMLRREPFRDIQLPECIHEYAAYKNADSNQLDVERATTVAIDVDKLDNLLEELDPGLKRRRQGAWQAFRSDNPDRLSQAANSMVELLDQVIGNVCQDTTLAKYLENKYHSSKDTRWVDATRKWVSETKSYLHRIKHHVDERPEQLTERLLHGAESILLVVLE